MTFIESILFLIVYISLAGIPLLWYAKQVSKNNAKETKQF